MKIGNFSLFKLYKPEVDSDTQCIVIGIYADADALTLTDVPWAIP